MPQPIVITPVSALDWPADDDLEETVIQCAGSSFLAYESRLLGRRDFLHGSSFYQAQNGSSAAAAKGQQTEDEDAGGKKKEYDLLTLSDRKLKKLSYYQVLSRSLPMHASTEEVRKAYHKACLKYHPDKTGRGEEDAVFLLVKAAFDTLSDPMKRRSYDSTVDFDEKIPPEGVPEEDFYAEYGPVFQRNLRFAAFNDPAKVKEIGARYGFQYVCYGHAGDGNLHVNIIKGDLGDDEWNNGLPKAIRELFQAVVEMGGTLSGEHGVGYVQKSYMDIAFDPVQLKLMKSIKNVFDPKGIMNPGKVFV